jgi:hypothetical protein
VSEPSITQAEFARRVGVAQSYLSTQGHGEKEPGAAILLAISWEFGKWFETKGCTGLRYALDVNFAAWEALSRSGHDRAQAFLDRAQALANESGSSRHFPGRWSQLQFLPADQYLRQGDPVRSLQELDRVATKLKSALGKSRELFLDELGNRYFQLGRLTMLNDTSAKCPKTCNILS